MTKEQLQQELKEKIKPGVKASDLKKLKKSKSADDIPSNPTAVPLSKSKSQEPLTKYPYTTLISQQEELDKLKKETTAKSDTISLLRKKIADLEQSNPPNQLLQDQLKEKQKELESLRKKLEEINQKLIERNTELDNSLQARYEAVKQFAKIYTKLQQVKQELDDNIDEASQELLSQDQTITKLRTKQQQAHSRIQELQKDLTLTQRLVKLKEFSPHSESDFSYLRYTLYGLIAIVLISWLTNKKSKN